MKGWCALGILIEPQTLQSGHMQMTNGDHPWQSSQGNSGDCKNYAVLKYAMLRELGVSPDALKIIVVEVRSSHQLLLDNRTLMLVESSMALEYYDPLYELDQNGIREFALPTRSTRLAQSLRPTRTP
jgi:hypothetical protein